MRLRSKTAAALMAGLLGASSLAAIASAAADNTAAPVAATAPVATQATDAQTQAELWKMSDEARVAVTQAQLARAALASKDFDTAKSSLADATKAFDSSKADLAKYVVKAKDETGTATEMVPFDMSMSIAEDFQPTDASKQAMDQAKDQAQKGDIQKAADTLKLAAVDVNVSAAMLPVDKTEQHLKQAAADVDQGKYDEADHELQALLASVVVQDYSLYGIPQQGDGSSSTAPSDTQQKAAG